MPTAFGVTADGTPAYLYTLNNDNGIEIRITNYGGIITGIDTPDRSGNVDDITLGYDSLDGYLDEPSHPYFGALIGRYANRIANGKFTLAGKTYQVPTNDSPNSLHGGSLGFDHRLWTARQTGNSLELTLDSADGEEGYPGNLHVKVIYTLSGASSPLLGRRGQFGTLSIDYTATADAETVVNLTNHAYFNLAGAGNGDILSTLLTIKADAFTPITKTLIPTGEIRPVDGTPFDFRTPTPIGQRINQPDEQLLFGGGYDHNWVLSTDSRALTHVATAHHPSTRRTLEVLTTQPGIQFYSGNFLDGANIGKSGKPYNRRTGFCLETQHFPDSPNRPEFPSTVLRPGETFHEVTAYRFSTE